MTIVTWQAEFYPTPSDSEEAQADPVGHSLRKWAGLLPENLEKHDCWIDEHRNIKSSDGVMPIDGDFCALCASYDTGLDGTGCVDCPLGSCTATGDDHHNPWTIWVLYENPYPMIDALLAIKENDDGE